MKFTQSQLDAIQHGDSNLQLIACAGSGKTEVVAQRIANLLKAGLKPGNLIAFIERGLHCLDPLVPLCTPLNLGKTVQF
jgi:hypothetical protein